MKLRIRIRKGKVVRDNLDDKKKDENKNEVKKREKGVYDNLDDKRKDEIKDNDNNREKIVCDKRKV